MIGSGPCRTFDRDQPISASARTADVRPWTVGPAALRPCRSFSRLRRRLRSGHARREAHGRHQERCRRLADDPDTKGISAWLEQRGGKLDDYAFPSRIDYAAHLSTRQFARLVDEWVTGIGLPQGDTARTHCGERKRRSSTRPPAIGGRSRSCSAIPKSRVRFATSAWTSRTRFISRKARRSSR